jgi:hypothetical protein
MLATWLGQGARLRRLGSTTFIGGIEEYRVSRGNHRSLRLEEFSTGFVDFLLGRVPRTRKLSPPRNHVLQSN